MSERAVKGLFDIRLRRSLKLKTFRQRAIEAATGHALPPSVVLPARTTLAVVDVETDALLCLTPSGRRVRVSAETCRESAYIPRKPRG